jgi:hypothetical protein
MKILIILKHIFIPHDENDYKPHFFREVGVSMLLFISIFLLGSSAGSSFFLHKTVLGAEVASSVLIDLTNESRQENSQNPLIRSSKLDWAAELKAKDMASKEYFSHNSPEGVTPWHWFKEVGYSFLYAGENLAINFTDSSDVEEAWLNSPTHRANIMNTEFREIGMATVQGVYKNYPTIYIVQMFGTPAYGKTVLDTKDTLAPPVKFQAEKIATTTLQVASSTEKAPTGDIKGVYTQASSTASTTPVSVLEKVVSTQDLAIVKNTSVASIPNNVNLPAKKFFLSVLTILILYTKHFFL